MKTNSIAVKVCTFVLIVLIIIPGTESCKDKNDESATYEKNMIISYMTSTQAKMQAPGWIAGIKSPTYYYDFAEGKADESKDIDITTADLIRIGSISKTFTATMVLILCDEGVLHLNEKLEDYYPSFLHADKVTIRQLLMHTSGMVSWDEDDEVRMQVYNNTGDWTIDKLIDWASQQAFHFEPGTDFHYSNIGYFLLGKIMEEATGLTVAEILEQKICIPLKLNHTFMPNTPHPPCEVIHGYDGSSGSVVDVTATPQADAINFKLAWTAGGILSTIDDLSVWSRALVHGQLLSDSLHQQQMPVPSPPSPTNPYWSGYGMGINQGDAWFGHTGAVSGYTCNMMYCPDQDVSIVTFFNKFSAFNEEENTADIQAVAENFLELARLVCPETFKPQ